MATMHATARDPRGTVLAAWLAAVIAPGPMVSAQPVEAPKITTKGIHFGGTYAGPDVKPENFTGRVVLLELWGWQCPPCARTMPQLEQLHRALGAQGLVVIGAHVQPGTPDEVRRAAAGLGVTFSIVGETGVEGLPPIPHMPFTLLFDHTGACVFMGSALEVRPAVAAALAAAPPLLLNGRPLEKLQQLAPLLKNEASYGTALKKARGLTSAKDEATAEEARFVVERIEAWGREAVDTAAESRAANPLAAYDRLDRCARALKGEPLATEATAVLVEWKKDPAFRAEVKSCEQLAKLESLRNAVGGTPLTPEAVAAVPQGVRRQMKELVDGIVKAAPGSKMAERAGEIGLELGLDAAPQP